MTAIELLRHNLAFCRMILTDYLEDLRDEHLFVRPVPGANHIAWQLGHLIKGEHGFLQSLGFEVPDLPHGFAEAYTKETAAIDDPARFHSKANYLQLMARNRAATERALDSLSEADLDKPDPKGRSYAPTFGAVLHLIGSHELMHAGQFIAVRRMAGMPARY
jgi:uncharacterized damage-inducible protein DinB